MVEASNRGCGHINERTEMLTTIVKSTDADCHAGDPLDTLILLLVKLADDNGIEEENLMNLVDEAVAKTGSVEAAIQAIEAGISAGGKLQRRPRNDDE